jgi:hypothetical protein
MVARPLYELDPAARHQQFAEPARIGQVGPVLLPIDLDRHPKAIVAADESPLSQIALNPHLSALPEGA